MPIDASIYSQIQQPKPVNALANMAQAYELQGAVQRNRLGDLQLQEHQRGLDDTSKMNALYSAAVGADGSIDRTKLIQGAAAGGLGSKIPALQKSLMEAETAGLTNAKTRQEVQNKRIAEYRDNLEQSATDPQSAAAYVTRLHTDPQLKDSPISQVPLDQLIAQIPQDPAGFAQWKQKFALGATEFIKQNKPTYQTQNLGDRSQILATPGLGGAPAVVSSSAINQSPDNIASNATSRANNAASVGASYANAGATREVAKATRDAATIQTGFKNEQDLRKEFEGLPEVKNYKQAYPAFAAIKDATSRNTTQSDINIVYGLAKLYDPTSVVREGEYATVANSPNIPEKVKGYAQYLAGGGRLSPETKKQILAEAQGRIGTYQAEAQKARGSYEGIAKTRGMNPAGVFADMGDMQGGAVAKPPASAAPSLPAGWTVKEGR